MYWANVVEMYQSLAQTEDVVRATAEGTYRKLIQALDQNPNVGMTFNVVGCLLDQLDRYGYTDLIDGIGRLVERGQVELTGNASFHPILPLIGLDEARRQIELDHQRKRQFFGDLYNPQGFFLPEMCYSFDVAEVVASYGYAWIIMDEIGIGGRFGNVKNDVLYEIDGLPGFKVFFRDRGISTMLARGAFSSAEVFVEALGTRISQNGYLLTAVDGGTQGSNLGIHLNNVERLLKQGNAKHGNPMVTVSRLMSHFTDTERVSPVPCSWSTWEDEIEADIPYPQWSYPNNEIHSMQWRLAYLVTSLVEMLPAESAYHAEARGAMDLALLSDQFQWASCRPWWNTNMVLWGATQLLGVVTLAAPYLPDDKVTEARQIVSDITREVQEWQSSGKAHQLSQEYLAKHMEESSSMD